MTSGQDISTLVAGNATAPIVPQNLGDVFLMAEAVCNARMNPPGLDTPQKVTVAILHGLEVGMNPMAALQSIAVINNRPCLFGDGMIGVVRASGLLEDIEETYNQETMTATCTAKRKGQKTPITRSFGKEDAIAAGLWLIGTNPTEKQMMKPWFRYPERMQAARARSWCLRDGFADALKGLSSKEEVEEMIDITPSISDSLSGSTDAPGFRPGGVDAEIEKLANAAGTTVEKVGATIDQITEAVAELPEEEMEEAVTIAGNLQKIAETIVAAEKREEAEIKAGDTIDATVTEAAQEPEGIAEAEPPAEEETAAGEDALQLARDIHADLKIRTTIKAVGTRVVNMFAARIDAIDNGEDAMNITSICVAHEERVAGEINTAECNAKVKRLGEAIKSRGEAP